MFALSVYLGHAALEHIFANNSILLQMICELLNEERLRIAAADCLLVVTERKRVRTFQLSALCLTRSQWEARSVLEGDSSFVLWHTMHDNIYRLNDIICSIVARGHFTIVVTHYLC